MSEGSLIEQSVKERESVPNGLTILAFAERKVDEIFQLYERELLGTLFFLCGGVESATLAVFASLREKCRLEAQTNEISNFRAWIFRSLFNEVADNARKRRKTFDRLEENSAQLSSSEPDESVFQRYGAVRNAILNLPFNERAVFLLRQNGDLSYEQIAQTINQTTAEVKQMMKSALIKLATTIEEFDETDRTSD